MASNEQNPPQMDPDEWKRAVVNQGLAICPVCGSSSLEMGACAIGAMMVHQEYTCEVCTAEFVALFGLVGFYRGSPAGGPNPHPPRRRR